LNEHSCTSSHQIISVDLICLSRDIVQIVSA